jgi:thiol-disulfide isomerase/thioredoxin
MSASQRAAISMAAFVLSASVATAQTATFKGTLSPALVDTISTAAPIPLFPAAPEVVAGLPVAPAPDAEVLAGKLTPARTLPTFSVALVTPKAGNRTLYVDLDQDGTYQAAERFDMPGGSVQLRLPVAIGVFNSLPVTFRAPGAYVKPPETAQAGQARASRSILMTKPRPGEAAPVPAKATMYANVLSSAAAIVDIGGKKVLFHYQVDLVNKRIDPLKSQLYVDTDGDGKMASAGNVESARATGVPLVFRAGTKYVATESVDVTTGEVVIREHPASDYKRIEVEVGKAIPDFAFKDLDGRDRKLSDYRGKYVLLDFWGTWCSPCVGEIPNMKAAYEKYGERGFEIVGMNMESPDGGLTPEEYKDDIEKVRAFMAGRGATWTQAAQQSIEKLAVEGFLVASYPVEILIGPDGKVAALELRGKGLEETLARLMGDGAKK